MSLKRALFSEPKVLITGVEGAGKTLFAVQQSDLLAKAEGGQLYQVNIRGADPHHLPRLPFDLREMSDQVDPETGDQLPRWAVDLEPGSVVIVDEAHKVYPQRGPGRPPKDIEMLGEGRQKGIRFVYLSQSPDSIDSFLRERIHRHFHLERRGNMERATVFEFDHYVFKPRTAWQERKDATTHFWQYPKEYYGWYTSAKSHHFKLRIPWKVWAALLFIPIMVWVAYSVISKVGGLASGVMPSAPGASATNAPGTASSSTREGRKLPVHTDPTAYAQQFFPLHVHQPWSAPAYQGREVVAHPELYCMSSTPGRDANERQRGASCSCITDQGTTYPMEDAMCKHLAQHGNYNPFRTPPPAIGPNQQGQGAKLGEAPPGPSSVRPAPPLAVDTPGMEVPQQIASYGDFRP